jgi:hypothetical protein
MALVTGSPRYPSAVSFIRCSTMALTCFVQLAVSRQHHDYGHHFCRQGACPFVPVAVIMIMIVIITMTIVVAMALTSSGENSRVSPFTPTDTNGRPPRLTT